MAYKLIEAAQSRWRAVNAPHLVVLVVRGCSSNSEGNRQFPHWFTSGGEPAKLSLAGKCVAAAADEAVTTPLEVASTNDFDPADFSAVVDVRKFDGLFRLPNTGWARRSLCRVVGVWQHGLYALRGDPARSRARRC